MILELVIKSFNHGEKLFPQRHYLYVVIHKSTFLSKGWRHLANETHNLYTICRQLYSEIVGQSLLYKFKEFMFSKVDDLYSYFWAIRPSHVQNIKLIEFKMDLLDAGLGQFRSKLDLAVVLAKLHNLQELYLTIVVISIGCCAKVIDKHSQKFEVVEEGILLMKDCKAFGRIRGLRNFKLNLAWMPPPSSPSVLYTYPTNRLKTRIRQLKEDMRMIMYVPKPENSTSQGDYVPTVLP